MAEMKKKRTIEDKPKNELIAMFKSFEDRLANIENLLKSTLGYGIKKESIPTIGQSIDVETGVMGSFGGSSLETKQIKKAVIQGAHLDNEPVLQPYTIP